MPGDLANPSALNGEGGFGEVLEEEHPADEISEGKMAERQSTGGNGHEEEGTSGRDMVFVCLKVRQW